MQNTNLTLLDLPDVVTMLSKEISELKSLLICQGKQEPQESPERLLSVQEASDFLMLSVATIYSKVSKGELPVMKRSKRLYFSSIELMQYLKDGRKKSNLEIDAEAESYLKNKGGKK